MMPFHSIPFTMGCWSKISNCRYLQQTAKESACFPPAREEELISEITCRLVALYDTLCKSIVWQKNGMKYNMEIQNLCKPTVPLMWGSFNLNDPIWNSTWRTEQSLKQCSLTLNNSTPMLSLIPRPQCMLLSLLELDEETKIVMYGAFLPS